MSPTAAARAHAPARRTTKRAAAASAATRPAPANLGPVWVQRAAPEGDDFVRLKTLSFRHALCGHGEPLRDTAYEEFSATFSKMFGI